MGYNGIIMLFVNTNIFYFGGFNMSRLTSSVLPLKPNQGTMEAIAQIERDAKMDTSVSTTGSKKPNPKDKGAVIDKKWK